MRWFKALACLFLKHDWKGLDVHVVELDDGRRDVQSIMRCARCWTVKIFHKIAPGERSHGRAAS